MKSKKQIIAFIIFGIATIVFILGFIQLALYVPAQLEMLKNALAQGTTAKQISDYYGQQFIPQTLDYIIQTLGISGILLACGMIYCKPMNNEISKSASNQAIAHNRRDNDDFFEDFDIVDNENQIEGE